MNATALTFSISTLTALSSRHLKQSKKLSNFNMLPTLKKCAGGRIFATGSTKSSSTFYSNENIKMNQYYEVEMKVQEHEVDHHGFANDVSYAKYCKEGHDELLEKVANSISENWEDSAVADLSFEVMVPLKKGDEFSVKVRVSCVSTRSIFIEYSVHRSEDQELVAKAESEMVLLDSKYRPISVSFGVRGRFLLLDFQDCSSD